MPISWNGQWEHSNSLDGWFRDQPISLAVNC
jgi:hypothetical protein